MVLVLGVGRCAFRPPRVVFVLGLVSLINSLTSGKKVGKRVGKSWGRIRHPRGGGDYRPVGCGCRMYSFHLRGYRIHRSFLLSAWCKCASEHRRC